MPNPNLNIDTYGFEFGSGGGGNSIQVEILPTPSAENYLKIYQYIGNTTENYKKGYFYICIIDPTSTTPNFRYIWVPQSVQASGNSETYVFTQSTPAKEWVITHNLEKFPSVTIVDSAGSVVIGDITFIDNKNIKLNFIGAFSGKAYLN